MKEIAYSVVRSPRRTMAVSVTRDGQVIVRCPVRTGDAAVQTFVADHMDWIGKYYQAAQERLARQVTYTPEEIKQYRELARAELAQRTAYWAGQMGVTYGRITIRGQVSRWGSCSVRGNLNYNWKLILVPRELLDYVVVHELAHRREMNHSQRFWDIVERELPDYKRRRKALRSYED